MSDISEKVYRILIPGVFDLLNVGHFKYISQAKQLFKNTEIVIGVMDPQDEQKYVGLTAMTHSERANNIKHVKNVDEVISICPWKIDEAFLKTNSIDFVVDNQFFTEFKYYNEIFGDVEKLGKLKQMKKMEVPKSSEYLRRVLYDLDLYLVRSIERGSKLEDLGIGVWKYKYLQLKIFMKKWLGKNCQKRKTQ